MSDGDGSKKTAMQLINARFEQLAPLQTYSIPASNVRRVSIVTDSVSSGSLFGGVGTALIFSALLANEMGAQLRIITRTQRAQPESINQLLALYGIKLKEEVQFKFAAFFDKKYEIDVKDGDVFVTTSWWTTAATLPSVPRESIIYLLQEDERMFYPYGDDRVKCEEILQTRDIRFLVNTKLLFDHLISDGLVNIATTGAWFEPAFPGAIYHPRKKAVPEKKRLFFYARPNNVRNLFYLGIDVIERAIAQKVLDTAEWEICLVGKDIPPVVFGGGYVPTKLENLSWSEYAELAGTIDIGLSLMSTPHPSYPPLDLAASGAVVVTNRFGNKTDLSTYSPNLICADLDRDALVDALRSAVALSSNTGLRERNYRNNGLAGDWQQAFGEVIKNLAKEI
ncbi:rhamnosyltransferase WsaF family glycosyltransferase [Paraburkholderia azotifigens]|uniref:rhamnosyltransferase WsaF family glycosyltransferase n=1 Tax=Paraburkholderia azotifigens TaxID=2057004 RepID=UPI0038B93FB4